VQDYLDRVTAADVAAGNSLGLERGVTDAFNTCLQALVADGILGVSGGVLTQAASLIKASCAMQGARTLSGSLVPLAADMPAPTNFNFVAGNYNRRLGLGDPNNVSKYLDSNRNNTAESLNSAHISVYVSTAGNGAYIGEIESSAAANGSQIVVVTSTASLSTRLRSSSTAITAWTVNPVGFIGLSRSGSGEYTRRFNSANTTVSSASIASSPQKPIFVFARNLTGNTLPTTGRLSFYGIGSALDNAILDARITALANAIQAAIAP
jgi:hypothetical protein